VVLILELRFGVWGSVGVEMVLILELRFGVRGSVGVEVVLILGFGVHLGLKWS
jgi:hypothetical protein